MLDAFRGDAELVVPGSHDLSGRFRGKTQIARWFERVRAIFKMHYETHDVVASGPPWRMKVCIRFTNRLELCDGSVIPHEGIEFVFARWGKLAQVIVYEDTDLIREAVERGIAARRRHLEQATADRARPGPAPARQ